MGASVAESIGPFEQLIRPTRMALLMPDRDGWEVGARHALEALSRIWGGHASVIVPFDPETGRVDTELWRLVSLFDPDIWGIYRHTGRALEIDDPVAFNNVVMTGSVGHEHEEHWLKLVRDDLRSADLVGAIELPATLIAELPKHAAPWSSDFDGRPHIAYLSSDSPPQDSMLVDAAELTATPGYLFAPDLSSVSETVRLQLCSRFGGFNPSTVARLTDRKVAVIRPTVSANEEDSARRLAWGLESPAWSLADALRDHGTTWAAAHPYVLAGIGLTMFTRSRSGSEPIVVVAGDTFADFAVAMAYDRLFGGGYWAPKSSWAHAFELAMAMRSNHVFAQHNRAITVATRSLDTNEIQDLAAAIGTHAHQPVQTVQEIALERRAARVWLDEAGPWYPPAAAPIDSAGLTGHLSPGMPTAATVDGHGMMWWCDVVRADHQLPQRSTLQNLIRTDTSFNAPKARVGSDGLTFAALRLDFVVGGTTMAQQMARPRLRFPTAEATFRAIAGEHQARLTESDKGGYARVTVERWGSREALTADLVNPEHDALLRAWQSRKASGVDPGNCLNGRRYLCSSDLVEVLVRRAVDEVTAAVTVRAFIDRLLGMEVVRRGVCLRCAMCRHMAFYDAEDIGQTFRCHRCRNIAAIDSTTTRTPDAEATWYYSLYEMVEQAFRHDFHAPMLAANELAKGADSVLWASEHDLQHGRSKMEVDLLMIVDGQIVIGEAKTTGELGDRATTPVAAARKYAAAAELLTADRVVFASTKPWNDAATTAIREAFLGKNAIAELVEL